MKTYAHFVINQILHHFYFVAKEPTKVLPLTNIVKYLLKYRLTPCYDNLLASILMIVFAELMTRTTMIMKELSGK